MNEKLFEILDRMFPGQFYLGVKGSLFYIITGRLLWLDDLKDAFWVADKVGLFKDGIVLEKRNKWRISEYKYFRIDFVEISSGDTPQEVMVKAIIAVYGEKS